MARISLIEPPDDEAAFLASWREERASLGARLLRSHSPNADFRFAELAPRQADPPAVAARVVSSRYQTVVDDLPPRADFTYALVNPFEVPEAEDDVFIPAWTGVRNLVKGRPGYVGSRLHRSLDPGARYRFINVAPWASVEAFTSAVADPAFARAARAIYHRAHPSLFVVLEG